MQPQLQATENLRVAQIIGVGTGSLKKGESRKVLNQWNRQAGGISSRMKSGKPGSQGLKDTMAGVGIKVVTVKSKKTHA